MPVLPTIGESLQVDYNDSLRSTEGFAQLRRVYSLSSSSNKVLETLGDMPRLEFIESGLFVHHNPKLVSLRNLPALTYVGEYVTVTNLPLLSSLRGLERLQRTRLLAIGGNPVLTSLSELSGLREVEMLSVIINAELTHLGLDGLLRVSGRFVVTQNPKLPECQATALATRVYASPPGWELSIRDNAPGPCP